MKQPKYWSHIDNLDAPQQLKGSMNNEFATDLPLEQKLGEATEESLSFASNRRDFLKLFGFGITAATLAACNETPLKKVIPYVNKPEDINPGVANWYSSVCNGCSAGCGVIVKTREGRPIKIEGNPDAQMNKGGVCATGHATILNMYDVDRLQAPKKGNQNSDWATVDKDIAAQLAALKAQGKGSRVRLVSSTINSPSTIAAVNEFLTSVGGGQHVMYDAVSYSAISQANEATFGKKVIPSYHFDKAEVIVSFGADFLGTWLSPVQYSAQYVTTRDAKSKKMSRHFQIEALMSLTGSNADVRVPVNPSQEGVALMNLYNKVAAALGQPVLSGVPAFNLAGNVVDKIAAELVAAKGKSLVVAGANDLATQQIVNGLNAMLGNYGVTIDLDNPSYQKLGDDVALAKLVSDIKGGQVDAVFFYDCNPVYETPFGEELKAAIAKVGLSVSFANKEDETSEVCKYTCPDSSEFESWNDASPVAGQYLINQPTINTIYQTRQAQTSLLKWAGNNTDYMAYVQNNWRNSVFKAQTEYTSFQTFWDEAVRKGVVATTLAASSTGNINATGLQAAATNLSGKFSNGKMDVVFYQKISIKDGKHANNPWLQEMPDPVTRTSWDNYVTVPIAYAKEKNLKLNDVVEVTVGNKKVKLAVVPQPGQAANTIGIALGYGRTKAGKTASKIEGSANVYPMVSMNGTTLSYSATNVAVNPTGDEYMIAKFQKYDLLTDANLPEIGTDNHFDRSHHIIRETTLENYVKSSKAGNELRDHTKKELITLWDTHYKEEETGRMVRWVMAIDLNKCTGCGACVVSCHAENNIPVVGKEEIVRHRDMHWMRIDRYYMGDYEKPETVSAVYQPMMCQHCANAPCETVCPVLATVHSKEGLNMMAYNRCVGTRYCANNCPYKVRRFNWFKYHNNNEFDFNMNNELGKMALNPDVTVRFRGVMEKCSFCVQRLQDSKLRAKINAGSSTEFKSKLEVKTACQQSCPTGAIVFGDLNDKNSEVAKLFVDDRAFTVLEEVKTLPSVSYMTKVRNRKAGEGPAHEEHGGHGHGAEKHEEKAATPHS
ncbi:MAG: 4Fe-4S dicluster domain-containing protein [Bacteroidia bacterium]